MQPYAGSFAAQGLCFDVAVASPKSCRGHATRLLSRLVNLPSGDCFGDKGSARPDRLRAKSSRERRRPTCTLSHVQELEPSSRACALGLLAESGGAVLALQRQSSAGKPRAEFEVASRSFTSGGGYIARA
jgi:hypothetical protein